MSRLLRYTVPAVALVILPFLLSGEPYWLDMLAMLGFWAALAGAWNLLAGYTGQVSLGHAAFGGIGAYALAITVSSSFGNAVVGLVIGVVLAVLAATLLGTITLRLRGPYFAIATIAFAQVGLIAAQHWKGVTNGTEGIFLPYEPGLGNLTFTEPVVYAVMFLGIAVLIAAGTSWIAPSRSGLFLRAIRDDTVAASSLGVRVTSLKLAAFAISAALAAVIGALNAARIGYVDPTGTMMLQMSIQIALIAVIGGIGRPSGPLVGAIAVVPLQFFLRAEVGGEFGALHIAVYGLILIIILRFAPGGLLELADRAWGRVRAARSAHSPHQPGEGSVDEVGVEGFETKVQEGEAAVQSPSFSSNVERGSGP
jgi:branched-chain amino acid transport system permease protein